MLEVTIFRDHGGARTPASFQFENDALQAFFDALTVDDTVQLVSLRSMTSPIVLTGGAGSAMPMRYDPKPAAKTAGPGAPRTQPTNVAKAAGPAPVKPATPEKK